MKTIFIFLFLTNVYTLNPQMLSSEKQEIEMLKSFYTAYLTAWSTCSNPDVHNKKLYALQKEYCSKTLGDSLKKYGLAHDPLINDEYTDIKHLKTLKVIKNPVKANTFIVYYIDSTLSPSYKPINKKVIIYVTIIKENEKYKIADAHGDAIASFR